MRILEAAAALGLVVASASPVSAQIVISEVNFTKGDQWIELYNPTTSDVSLGSWSIYHATKTLYQVNDYWWGFPSTAVIKKDDYVRIYWGAALQTSTEPRNFYTGDTNWHFLFGHGYEALDPTQGALAICGTQDNKSVNNANIFMDWWQWGDTGFKRESLAIGNKPTSLWNANSKLPQVPSGASLMVLRIADKFPHPLDAIVHDYSPTPLAHNASPLSVSSVGKACTTKPSPTISAELVAEGYPYHGNKDFALTVKNTQGPAYFESMLLVVNLGKTTSYFSCTVLDPAAPGFITPFLPTAIGSTTVKVPLLLTGIQGFKFYVMGAVFSSSRNYDSFTNQLVLEVSK